MGGTLTREEWFKLLKAECERALVTCKHDGDIVVPLAHQMTAEERVKDAPRIWREFRKHKPDTDHE